MGQPSQKLLKIIHIDINKPYLSTLYGNKYFITFINDYSIYGHVYLIKDKSGTLEKFKIFKIESEKQTKKITQVVRSN